MAGKDVVSQLLHMAQPFGTLSPPETRKLQNIAIVPADFLQREAASFIERHCNDPIVVWWSVDTTPLTIRESLFVRWSDSNDFMIQRVFMPAHDFDTTVLFEPPRVAAFEIAWTAFEFFRQLVPMPMP